MFVCDSLNKKKSFSGNSEAFASGLLENLEEIFGMTWNSDSNVWHLIPSSNVLTSVHYVN